MGAITSRFGRKKSTKELLDKLESTIKNMEIEGKYKEQTHKRIMGYIMVYSIGLYVVLVILYYYLHVGRSHHWLHSLMYASPLLVLPIVVIFLRSAISWYYRWSLDKNRKKLEDMREEKKKILEEVMNTETYKVAKEILDKYGSQDQPKMIKPFIPSPNTPGNTTVSPYPATPGQLRQRQLSLQTSTPISNNRVNLATINSTPIPIMKPHMKVEQLPRPLPDRYRSTFDKVLDYVLKDGPTNRMALICAKCNAHNGMAMQEEFEFVAYICAYCGHKNPARKKRPIAPPLTLRPQLSLYSTSFTDQQQQVAAYDRGETANDSTLTALSSESNSNSNSDSESNSDEQVSAVFVPTTGTEEKTDGPDQSHSQPEKVSESETKKSED